MMFTVLGAGWGRRGGGGWGSGSVQILVNEGRASVCDIITELFGCFRHFSSGITLL